MINGKQFTVLWHVDDLKISHKDKKTVDQFIEWAINKYEDSEITKLKPSRGVVHDYLGVALDYSERSGKMVHERAHQKNVRTVQAFN